MSTDDRDYVTLRVNLKGEQLARFLKIKERHGLENDTEVIRLLISKDYEDESKDVIIKNLQTRLDDIEEMLNQLAKSKVLADELENISKDITGESLWDQIQQLKTYMTLIEKNLTNRKQLEGLLVQLMKLIKKLEEESKQNE